MSPRGTKEKILVTGGTGLLGSTLVPMLRAHKTAIISHGYSSEADCQADLTLKDEAHRLLDAHTPDIIINLVALTNVDQCEENPDLAHRLNVKTVENLASWQGLIAGCRLIQISTDQVYDGHGPSDEEAIALKNIYALSKHAGELAAQKVGATILRTNVFGASRHPSRRSFSDWILDNLKSKQPITIFDDILFSPLSFVTLSRMIEIVIEKPITGVFNLGSRAGLSKADFAMEVAATHGLPTDTLRRGRSRDVKLRAYRPKDMRMNVRKFEDAFGVSLPKLIDDIHGMGTAHA